MSPLKATEVPVANSPDQEIDTWKTIPNLITALRILMIVPFCYCAMNGQDWRGVVIFFIAGVSDSFDGVLARWLKQRSKIGRLIDPVADKVLAGIAYVVLSFYRGEHPAIPVWVTGMVVTRDVMILLGCWIVYREAHTTAFKPTIWGKLNTLIELLTIGWFLTAQVYPVVAPALPVLYVSMALTIVISFTGYARQGVAMIRDARP